jgi:hypothetical protein
MQSLSHGLEPILTAPQHNRSTTVRDRFGFFLPSCEIYN